MFIGEILKQRMDALNISIQKLSEETFLDVEYLSLILNNKISTKEIHEIDLEFISNALYCSPQYFLSEEARKKDIIHASMNRGLSDKSTNLIKGKLQRFANDFIFIKNIMNEVKGGI